MRPLAWAAIGIGCLVAAQVVASVPLAEARRTLAPAPEAGITAVTPGEFAGTLMLGGFRGLACDLLWIRAESAKDHRRFYESQALFRTISRIQPRFAQVWIYLSWDMAYNIGHEVEDPDAKWTWLVAGIEANAEGCRRNPHSEQLLRHLAWIFNHRGEQFQERIAATDWAPLLRPLIAQVQAQLPAGTTLPAYPEGGGQSSFRVAAHLYRACVELAAVRSRVASSIIPRMVPLAIEKDGDVARNRGEHLAALRIWIEGLEAWAALRARLEQPHTDIEAEARRRNAIDSWERNEGDLRRKAAMAARLLAPDAATGERVADDLMARRIDAAREGLALSGWKNSASFGTIRWMDEGGD